MTAPFQRPRNFASDNCAGIAPEALAALIEANRDHAPSYGNDPWTDRACDLIREIFETDCEVFFTFTGTTANALSLAAMCRSYHAVLCHERAHVEDHECAAPEFFSGGAKLVLLPGDQDRLTPDCIEAAALRNRGDFHASKVHAVTITQPTEAGTLYLPAEVAAIGDTCRRLGLHLHLDGARFANAVASLGCKPADITWRAGVDLLSFGLTKNGVAVGDTVVFFKKEMSEEFEYRLKQGGQLASKMRFLAAQYVGLLTNSALAAPRRQRQCHGEAARSGVAQAGWRRSDIPRGSHFVFAALPQPVIDGLRRRGWQFYAGFQPQECRLVCAWDTQPEDVDAFAADVHELLDRA